MTSPEERTWLTVREFRERHHLSKNLVYDAVRENCLPYAKIGSKIMIPSDALDQLVRLPGHADGPAED